MLHSVEVSGLQLNYPKPYSPTISMGRPTCCTSFVRHLPVPLKPKVLIRKGNSWIETITAEAQACETTLCENLCLTQSHYTCNYMCFDSVTHSLNSLIQKDFADRHFTGCLGLWDDFPNWNTACGPDLKQSGEVWGRGRGWWHSHVHQTAQRHQYYWMEHSVLTTYVFMKRKFNYTLVGNNMIITTSVSTSLLRLNKIF